MNRGQEPRSGRGPPRPNRPSRARVPRRGLGRADRPTQRPTQTSVVCTRRTSGHAFRRRLERRSLVPARRPAWGGSSGRHEAERGGSFGRGAGVAHRMNRSGGYSSQVIPYFAETLAYASGPIVPERSASASSRTKPSNPAGEQRTRVRPVRGTTRRCAWGTPRGPNTSRRTGVELLFADLEHVLAFEHVEQLILVLVNVKRRVERRDLFDDAERTACRIRGGLDDYLRIAEPKALSVGGVEHVCRSRRRREGESYRATEAPNDRVNPRSRGSGRGGWRRAPSAPPSPPAGRAR